MTISVSKWTLDKHIGLSKPFLPVNTEDVPFDAMRQPVHNKLYFAGEVRFRLNCTEQQFHEPLLCYIRKLKCVCVIRRL